MTKNKNNKNQKYEINLQNIGIRYTYDEFVQAYNNFIKTLPFFTDYEKEVFINVGETKDYQECLNIYKEFYQQDKKNMDNGLPYYFTCHDGKTLNGRAFEVWSILIGAKEMKPLIIIPSCNKKTIDVFFDEDKKVSIKKDGGMPTGLDGIIQMNLEVAKKYSIYYIIEPLLSSYEHYNDDIYIRMFEVLRRYYGKVIIDGCVLTDDDIEFFIKYKAPRDNDGLGSGREENLKLVEERFIKVFGQDRYNKFLQYYEKGKYVKGEIGKYYTIPKIDSYFKHLLAKEIDKIIMEYSKNHTDEFIRMLQEIGEVEKIYLLTTVKKQIKLIPLWECNFKMDTGRYVGKLNSHGSVTFSVKYIIRKK